MIIKGIILILAYVLGSVPTAAWYAKYIFGIDIKAHGSGNSGATNSLRVMGKKAGIFVLIADILKGFLPVYLYNYFFQDAYFALLIGIFIIIGHVFSVFVNFKGGKGVASAFGVIVAVYPFGALLCVPVFIAVVILTKYVSLASLIGALAFVLIISLQNQHDIWYKITASFLFIFLMYTHRQNIAKILNGTENKFKT